MDYVTKIDVNDLKALPEWSIEQLVSPERTGTKCTVGCVTTPAGEGSPAGTHDHPFDQVLFILEGVLQIDIDGQTHEAGPGAVVAYPANVPHRNWNKGPETTVHLVFNTAEHDPS